MQSCCFADINLLLFFQFSLLSSVSLLKLPIAVIQKFCYHGNETSHLNELSNLLQRPLLVSDRAVIICFVPQSNTKCLKKSLVIDHYFLG